MSARQPLISIGLPVYNGQNFVADAIKCTLAQTVSDFELIISDNNSSDDTVSICRGFAAADSRIRLHCNEQNLGVAPNYNRVFQLSCGRYFKWITHDDLFAPAFVECCIEALENDERAVLVFPRLGFVDATGQLLRTQQTPDLSVVGSTATSRVKQLMRFEAESEEIFWCQYGVMRRRTLEDTSLMGPYNGSDQVLLLELALKGNLKQVQQELFLRREHPAASTMRSGWTARERAAFVYAGDRRSAVFPYFRMLKEHIACLRGGRIALPEKAVCTLSILRRFFSQWKYFAYELFYSSLEAVRGR